VASLIPAWGERPFQALGCELSGMRLAVPLDQLGTIVPWNGELTRLPRAPAWQMGILLVRGQQVRVVDLARLLLPQPTPPSTRGYVLVLKGERWGLACGRLQAPFLVQPQTVRWRRTAGRPAGLVGVLPESLLPILDVDEVLARLDKKAGQAKE
jgi:purine-binding chemotaxis protein CheW